MAFKTNLDAKFRMDTDKEEQGIWVDFGEGVRFRIRRFKSAKSVAVRKELDKPHADMIRRGTVSQDVAEELLNRHIAAGIVVDWEGVNETTEDGSQRPIPYSAETAYRLLKELPELREELLTVTVERDAFRAKVDEDAVKNSLATSAGS